MSADEAMQPESTADELENVAPPDDLEDAAEQQDSDADPDSASEPDRVSEDVAEPLVEDVSEEDADLAEDITAADAEADLEESAENIAVVSGDVSGADTSDMSDTSTPIDTFIDTSDEVLDYAAESEGVNYEPEPTNPDQDISDQVTATDISDVLTTEADTDANPEAPETSEVSEVSDASDAPEVSYESLAESSATLAENEAAGAEEVTEAAETADASAAKSGTESDTAAQDSEPENIAAPPVTPSIPVQILETLQTILGVVLPILRAVTVLVLKITIRVLQFVVDLLDEPKSEPSTASQSPTNAANMPSDAQDLTWNQESRTGAIAYSMADLTNAETDDEDAEVKRVRFTIDDIYQDDGSLRPLPERLKEIWQDLIRVMRAPLPTAMNQQIPDKVFSVILAAVLAIVIWNLAAFILPSKSSPRKVQVTKPQPTEVGQPSATEQPRAEEPATDTTTEPTSAPDIAQPAPTPTPTVQPTPAPTATPQLELEPRDTVIEAIQQQVSEVTQRYADNLIQSVQANFRDGRLTVRVSDDWYRLEASRQDQVVTDLLKRTKNLDFGKLELLDSQDNRVARNPIVGNKVLILQRDRTDVTGPIETPINPPAPATEQADQVDQVDHSAANHPEVNAAESQNSTDAIPAASTDKA
ncbi:MAG: hypothetical protein ACTS2F_01335 [Thainema sp.]